MDADGSDLSAALQEIRDRVRARHPSGSAIGGIPLPDLLPLLRARDSAEGKVASIGTVNPRSGGPLNAIIQKVKRFVARALDWHVREQVEFNRAAMNCIQAAIEALSENNRALAALAGSIHEVREGSHVLVGEARELKDVRTHWVQWRQEWESKLSSTEIQFLRTLSDLQGAWQHRVTLQDESHRERMKTLHAEFQGALDRASADIQKRLWTDMERVRVEYETVIHGELRLLRQKAAALRPTVEHAEPVTVDWLKHADKFRGTEDYVKRNVALYTQRFQGAAGVLDIGCGRGELLEVFREAGIPAHGLDLNDECIAWCLHKGLRAEKGDLFTFLADQPDASLGGIVAMQLVEHLPPARVPEFVALAHAKLRQGAILALETPNPECLAIFARHFYLDPTHAKPLPPALLAFYLEEAGFGLIEVVRLEPAIDSMPSLASIPEDFRRDFFGSLDYAIFGRKL